MEHGQQRHTARQCPSIIRLGDKVNMVRLNRILEHAKPAHARLAKGLPHVERQHLLARAGEPWRNPQCHVQGMARVMLRPSPVLNVPTRTHGLTTRANPPAAPRAKVELHLLQPGAHLD